MVSKSQYWKNPEYYRDKAKKYQKDHPEQHNKRCRRYREVHKEQDRQYHSEYQQRPEVKEKRRVYQIQRRERFTNVNSAYHNVARHCELDKQCEFCPSTENLEAHHFTGYELWYIFVTVCPTCHRWIDRNPS